MASARDDRSPAIAVLKPFSRCRPEVFFGESFVRERAPAWGWTRFRTEFTSVLKDAVDRARGVTVVTVRLCTQSGPDRVITRSVSGRTRLSSAEVLRRPSTIAVPSLKRRPFVKPPVFRSCSPSFVLVFCKRTSKPASYIDLASRRAGPPPKCGARAGGRRRSIRTKLSTEIPKNPVPFETCGAFRCIASLAPS